MGVPGKEAIGKAKQIAEVKMDMDGGIYGSKLCFCIMPDESLRVVVVFHVFPNSDDLNTS